MPDAKPDAKGGLPYEEAAHVVTVTGWACKACRRWWGNDGRSEHMARFCCAKDAPCETEGCAGRRPKSYTICPACDARLEEEKWQARCAKAAEWDGETPLCEYRGDRFFWTPEDIEDYLDDGHGGDEGRTLEDLRLCLCEPSEPREFSMSDHLSDHLPEDCPDSWEAQFEAIDAAVNGFIKAGPHGGGQPWGWHGTNVPVTLESLRRFVREPDPAETGEEEGG